MTVSPRTVRRGFALTALALLSGVGAVFDVTHTSAQREHSRHATLKVLIQSYSFKPKTVKVHVGDTVIFTNLDADNHTVTTDKSGTKGLSSPTLGHRGVFKFTAKKSGKYAYHCAFHPFMKGTIVVKAK